jgi:hypothetical protein
MIEESKWVPQKTTVTVSRPYVPTEFEHLFSAPQSKIWAAFLPPPEYYERVGRYFSYQLIPSLGSYEKQETDTDKIASLEDVLKKPHSRKREGGEQGGSDERDRKRSGNGRSSCPY